MYRDDLAATHARLETIQRDLTTAQSQGVQDQQRIAMLTAQLQATQAQLQQLGAAMRMQPMQPMGYGYGASYTLPPRHSTVLVLGICSLVLCTALGPFAWAMGSEEIRRIDSGLTSPEGRGSAQAGRVCGIVSSCFLGFGVLMFLFFMLVASSTSR